MLEKYHITFGEKRTTISVDTILSQLMAIKLGKIPATLEAHGAVREWLQERLVFELGDDEVRKDASQWARRYLIESIVDKKISNQWENWWLEVSEE